jgi:large subunit ribosomal protein L21
MRKRGHRQDLSVVEITKIIASGAKAPTATAVKAPAASKPVAAVSASAGKMDTSNLSLISGIGPTIEKKLRAAGVLNWEQIASWSDADLASWNEKLELRNRATREEWVEQAKELLAGKAPRAKVDQVELKSGKDY